MKKILLILSIVFFSVNKVNLVEAKCSFNCPKFVKNEALILWDKSSHDSRWCTPNLSPSVQKYSSVVKRYKYPYPENGFETFLVENAYTLNSAISNPKEFDFKKFKAQIIELATSNSFSKLDWTGRGGSPAFATAIVIKSVAYSYALIDEYEKFTEKEAQKVRDWVVGIEKNIHKKANSLDHEIAVATTHILWGAASKDDTFFKKGQKGMMSFLNKTKKNGKIANDVRNNNEIMHHLIQGAEVLELNGIKIYSKVFNDLTLHEIVKSHAKNVLDVGNKKTKTSGDMYDPARSIMRSQGYGTHIAWVPIYLKRFKNHESSNAVIELRQALREKYRDRKPFFGQQIAINTSCYYGDKI